MGANAAHEPRPAAGGRIMPSTVTVTSVRGQPIFTTPSGVAVAVAPLASPIALASSGAGGAAMLSADISALATRHPAIHVTVIRKAAKRSYRRAFMIRSEEHTSELQSLRHLVCRLLLEKKKKTHTNNRKNTLTHTT